MDEKQKIKTTMDTIDSFKADRVRLDDQLQKLMHEFSEKWDDFSISISGVSVEYGNLAKSPETNWGILNVRTDINSSILKL